MRKSVSEILNAAADLLEQPGAWTQGTLARNETGAKVENESPAACSFCVLGAIYKVAPDNRAARRAIDAFEVNIGCLGATVWNDVEGRTQAEVVAALRAAAKQAEGGEA